MRKSLGDNERMVRIYFTPEESGWAAELPGGKFRIANIPMDGAFNIDDEVTVINQPDEHGPKLIAVSVSKRKYPVRTVLWYATAKQWKAIYTKAEARGGKAEGFLGPSKDRPGVGALALLKAKDAEEIAREVGVWPQPPDWEPNYLGED